MVLVSGAVSFRDVNISPFFCPYVGLLEEHGDFIQAGPGTRHSRRQTRRYDMEMSKMDEVDDTPAVDISPTMRQCSEGEG